MTVQEAGKILNLLMTAYPHFYQNYTKAERDSLKMFWASLFEQDDVRIVEAAVKSFIQSDEKGFPPVPGQVRAKMRLIVGRNELSAAEAWGMVMDIINPPDENAHFQAYPEASTIRKTASRSSRLWFSAWFTPRNSFAFGE